MTSRMSNGSAQRLRRNTVFVHIEKAAGSSFIKLLEDNHGPAVVRLDGSVADHGLQLVQKAPTPHIVCGHFYKRLIDSVWSRLDFDEYDLITFLRNPVERVVSQYSWGVEKGQGAFWDKIRAQDIGLDRFVSERMLHTVSNWQTKVLANLNRAPERQRSAGPTDLERAMHNLGQFAFVGLVERYDESVERLAPLLGLARTASNRLNASRRSSRADALPEKVRAVIEAGNSLDLRLYTFAEKLFSN